MNLPERLRSVAESELAQEEYLSDLLLDAADEIEAWKSAWKASNETATLCKCGSEAWCPCLDHVASWCPGTPLVGMRSGHQPSHIPEGAILCPNCNGEPGDHQCLCKGQGWVQDE